MAGLMIPEVAEKPTPVQAITAAWNGRAKAQGLKPGTKTYSRLKLEFILGAVALAEANGDAKQSATLGILAMLTSVGR